MPLNIISRYVLGVRPLEPGFEKTLVCPQTGNLKSVRGVIPTRKGPVGVDVSGGRLAVSVRTSATIVWQGRSYDVRPGRHVFAE